MVVRVEDFMTKKVITIEASSTIFEAAKLLAEKAVGSLVVVEKGKPVGIVTDRDIVLRGVVRGLDLKKEKIEAIMSKPLLTVSPETPMLEAIEMMDKHSIRRIPVVRGAEIVGIVTSSDIGRASKVLAPYLLPRVPEIYLVPQKSEERYKTVD
ncbi:MAG: cyclic nucleotide-binding/CBS domain-containing protein [Candidatus Hadarchaeales archaeon]